MATKAKAGPGKAQKKGRRRAVGPPAGRTAPSGRSAQSPLHAARPEERQDQPPVDGDRDRPPPEQGTLAAERARALVAAAIEKESAALTRLAAVAID